jgi:hypothetical protein
MEEINGEVSNKVSRLTAENRPAEWDSLKNCSVAIAQ